jgi:hypothetical protein
MRLHGRQFNKQSLLRYIGNEKQLFGIRPMVYRGGDANLVNTYEVDTGSGLVFSVAESKAMDIFQFKYKGINLAFESKAGLHSPYNVEPFSDASRFSQGCGMLYTAGLTNVGGPCQDETGVHYYHGMIKNKAASDICAQGAWRGDEYVMQLSGDVNEAAFYGRNLKMHRTITTSAGSKAIVLEDCIENRAYAEDQVMLLYHLNAGYPLVSEEARLIAAVNTVEPATPRAQEMIAEYDRVSAPMDMEEEYVYCITLHHDEEGLTGTALWNEALNLGLYVKYNVRPLDRFVEWKCMRSGDYAFGMLPSNCFPFGRLEAAKSGAWTVLKPFETMSTRLEIGILEGREEMKEFEGWIESLKKQT